jgi:hypothetical protein
MFSAGCKENLKFSKIVGYIGDKKVPIPLDFSSCPGRNENNDYHHNNSRPVEEAGHVLPENRHPKP